VNTQELYVPRTNIVYNISSGTDLARRTIIVENDRRTQIIKWEQYGAQRSSNKHCLGLLKELVPTICEQLSNLSKDSTISSLGVEYKKSLRHSDRYSAILRQTHTRTVISDIIRTFTPAGIWV